MPKKCESCRHYTAYKIPKGDGECSQPIIGATAPCNLGRLRITAAREICNKEGDGHFVYFEPKDPATGAAFIQITREPRARVATGGAR